MSYFPRSQGRTGLYLAGGVVLLIVYVLSIGPVQVLVARFPAIAPASEIIYQPLYLLPPPASKLIGAYCIWWFEDTHTPYLLD